MAMFIQLFKVGYNVLIKRLVINYILPLPTCEKNLIIIVNCVQLESKNT